MFDKLRTTNSNYFSRSKDLGLDDLAVKEECLWSSFPSKRYGLWWIEKCGRLIWSCYPRNPQRKVGEEKRRRG